LPPADDPALQGDPVEEFIRDNASIRGQPARAVQFGDRFGIER
jgi:hypothetical protein